MDDSYLSPEARARIAESVACRQNISREQRRYEIARDCAAAIAGENYEREPAACIADYAVSIANALLAELEKEPTA